MSVPASRGSTALVDKFTRTLECNRSTQLALAMLEAFDAPDSKIAGAILLY
jgi:hypothetical protein